MQYKALLNVHVHLLVSLSHRKFCWVFGSYVWVIVHLRSLQDKAPFLYLSPDWWTVVWNLRDWRFEVRTPAGERSFSRLQITLTGCAVHMVACLMGNSHFPAGVERPGRGSNWHGWICVCTPQYAFVGVFMDAFTPAFTSVCVATFCPECSVSLIPRLATAL
jgi:hypothetical protein